MTDIVFNIVDRLFPSTVESVIAKFGKIVARLEQLETANDAKAQKYSALAANSASEAARASRVKENLRALVS